jgi:exosortase J
MKKAKSWMGLAYAGLLASLLCVAGIFSVYPYALALWVSWTDDPLKSVGGLVPIVSLILILRVWHSLGWETEGSWWGLVILAVTITIVHIRDVAIIELVMSPSWTMMMPPASWVATAYAAGAVLLFGGSKLLRAARFPVALMFLVNPAPNFFLVHFDLPLQHASSMVARGFAHALGQQLTPDQLLLMFTPQFGMFIAPGCNGIRGAITMGLIALVAGYLYQFKPRMIVLAVFCAVLLGYVFNLVRLCSLVLYYLVALHVPWLQPRATTGDYIIGACLFFFATAMLFTLIQKFSPTGDMRLPLLPHQPNDIGRARLPSSYLVRCSAFAVLILLGSVSYAKVLLQERLHPQYAADVNSMGEFPERVGGFHLTNRWNETMFQGPLVFYWADYTDDQGTKVSVAVSPVLGAHDSLLCRKARGEDWQWHGNLPMTTQQGEIGFSGSFYMESNAEYLEATTICNGGSCGQYSSDRTTFGFVYSVPKTNVLLNPSPTRPIPVMLRASSDNVQRTPDVARAELTQTLREFLSAANLPAFTAPYRKQ